MRAMVQSLACDCVVLSGLMKLLAAPFPALQKTAQTDMLDVGSCMHEQLCFPRCTLVWRVLTFNTAIYTCMLHFMQR
jgi:hypothetical protein